MELTPFLYMLVALDSTRIAIVLVPEVPLSKA
jgi:hypothetical protein